MKELTEKQESYLKGSVDRFVEESIREDNTFDKEWFISNIRSIIKEIIRSY